MVYERRGEGRGPGDGSRILEMRDELRVRRPRVCEVLLASRELGGGVGEMNREFSVLNRQFVTNRAIISVY